jgi:predicted short-subunit dehydrogenase-like oxidoreductase (DUF2520 family)
MMSIALIGAGPVGTAIAVRSRDRGHRIAAIVSRRASSARKLAKRVGCSLSGTRVRIIPPDVDLVVLTVPDGSIERVAMSLAASAMWSRKTGFIHTSGSLSSDLLAVLRSSGYRVASLHPVQSFSRHADPRAIDIVLEGVWWGVECSAADRRWAGRIARSLGGRPFAVPKEAKIAYHLACTFASNYPVLLWFLAEQLGRTAGVPRGMAPFVPLIHTTLANAQTAGALRALTGPAVRRDLAVLRSHRDVLRRAAPAWIGLFDALVARARSVSKP